MHLKSTDFFVGSPKVDRANISDVSSLKGILLITSVDKCKLLSSRRAIHIFTHLDFNRSQPKFSRITKIGVVRV